MSHAARIVGTGMYVPPNVVSNAELAAKLETSEQWIVERTGIRERRFAEDGVGVAELAESAARDALESAGLSPRDIDLILFATLSPDVCFPGSSSYLQRRLDLAGVPTLDIRNQCSGFLYGLAVGEAFVVAGRYQRVLLVGAEVQSTGLDLSKKGRDISILFGDGAGAVVIARSGTSSSRILEIRLHADGREADALTCIAPQSSRRPRISNVMLEEGLHYPRMDGRRVFRHAVRRLSESILEVLSAGGLTIGDIRCFIIHQANLRIVESVASRLGIASDQLFNNIALYGNTTAASVPIALHEAVESGRIDRGDLIMLSAFGSGFTWGSVLVRW